MFQIKCKHCCKELFTEEYASLLTSHSEMKKHPTDSGCKTDDAEPLSYLSVENAPRWIMDIVNQESWTKGRINCPHCKSRLGSFNLVNELKCNCGSFVTPPIRIIHSKVDVFVRNEDLPCTDRDT